VFSRSGETWRQQALLRDTSPSDLCCFGFSVAASGSFLAVGARGDFDSVSEGVFIFRREGESWTQEALIRGFHIEGPDLLGLFARSIDLSGDTLALGADSDDSDATGVDGDRNNGRAPNSGAVLVFSRQNGTWSQEAYIKASNTGAGDRFGLSVALDGDKLVVGAPLEDARAFGVDDYGHEEDDRASDSGAAYVFVREDRAWHHHAYLKASNTQIGAPDTFGSSVGISGDTIVIGAPKEDSSAKGVDGNQGNDNIPNSGAVYVYR
jgi:hypothetical protein